ncbi:MAG: DNA replication/repair protein RecF, partial [Gammaproteobacteria bacterium]|nr:DNA replication/repair protein RecF [Gammaproteobacteria bacterium]
DLHSKINIITGNNGSGKTSLLETIYLLCNGCSFRSNNLAKAIRHEENSFLLFGRFADYKAGLSRSSAKLEIRINGKTVKKRSLLAQKTPINIVNASSLELINGPPQNRRQYIDWSLFHVEQDYNENWIKYRHALKQRNKLLKQRKDLSLLSYWDEYLVQPALLLQQYRMDYCEKIKKIMEDKLPDLWGDMGILIKYQKGWNDSLDLQKALLKDRDRDIKAGFTHSGVHRDNLTILSHGLPAAEVLSRGQMKRASLALLLAALTSVKESSGRSLILLVDDLNAEMDQAALNSIYNSLLDLDLQLFITSIEKQVPSPLKGKEFKMLHVEHGTIKDQKFS